MSDFMIAGIIIIILSFAIAYIVRAKKKGVHCIGCPDAGKCAGNCSNCAGYTGKKEDEV